MKRQQHTHRRGILAVEIGVGLVLLALLVALTASAMLSYVRTRERYAWRRAAAWAAEAQWQRCVVGVDPKDLPPDGTVPDEVTFHVDREPGAREWEGFDRVTITASVVLPAGGGTVQEEVSGHLPQTPTTRPE